MGDQKPDSDPSLKKSAAASPPVSRSGPEDGCRSAWGFADTAFFINQQGRVELSGQRYELSGKELPDLLPWVAKTLRLDIPLDGAAEQRAVATVVGGRANPGFMAALEAFLGPRQWSTDDDVRRRHGHGHSLAEIFALTRGGALRVPDVVLYPETEEEVDQLVRCAKVHHVCLIPYGGGTNVSQALLCPANEDRLIASVDMARLNQILWLDPVNRTAKIQAGITGRELEAQLAQRGYTLGHEPDSIEFSTLGGWVATNASGMKKNRYGNIEDIVLDLTVVTSEGILERRQVVPRESIGCDPRRWVFGSEGNLGIITSAVVKLHRQPACRRYGSILFPSFSQGFDFLYALSEGGVIPASVRLVDNQQFQFSMALKPGSRGLGRMKSGLQKWFVTRLRRFDPQAMVACTLLFEGSEEEVRQQERAVYTLARRHRGLAAGEENGRRGYALTFSIAYIRDFVLRHGVMAESFETSVSWSEALPLIASVRQRIAREHRALQLPGEPFISARITQLYRSGVAIYFYLAFYARGVDQPCEVFERLENAAREEIMAHGGSLSHHHGVGKIRQQQLASVLSPTGLRWNREARDAFDPSQVFGVRNASSGDAPGPERHSWSDAPAKALSG